MNPFELAVLYTNYVYDCEDEGIEPLSEKEWLKEFEEME